VPAGPWADTPRERELTVDRCCRSFSAHPDPPRKHPLNVTSRDLARRSARTQANHFPAHPADAAVCIVGAATPDCGRVLPSARRPATAHRGARGGVSRASSAAPLAATAAGCRRWARTRNAMALQHGREEGVVSLQRGTDRVHRRFLDVRRAGGAIDAGIVKGGHAGHRAANHGREPAVSPPRSRERTGMSTASSR